MLSQIYLSSPLKITLIFKNYSFYVFLPSPLGLDWYTSWSISEPFCIPHSLQHLLAFSNHWKTNALPPLPTSSVVRLENTSKVLKVLSPIKCRAVHQIYHLYFLRKANNAFFSGGYKMLCRSFNREVSS